MSLPLAEYGHPLEIPILAWAGWLPDGTLATGGTPSPAAKSPSVMPASLRRRVTTIGRQALEAAWSVLNGREDIQPRIVLSSRHGEYQRTFGLLQSLATGDGVSPAEFSLAVHHGLAGLLSIATGNTAGHTAIAAGRDTLGAALTEAAVCLAGGDETVLLIHFDEAPPADYATVGGGSSPPCAFALLLGKGGRTVCLQRRAPTEIGGDGAEIGLLGLLGDKGTMVEWAGERQGWRLVRAE